MSFNTSALTGTANQLMGQQQGLFNGILSQLGAGGGYGNAASGMMGLLGPLLGIFGKILGGAGAQTPQMMQQFMQLASNPQALAAFTGINAPGMTQGATIYLSHPGQTNLAQMFPGANAQLGPGQSALGLGGGQAMDFYRNEMQTGINPQFALNAQNQLQQQFGTSVSDILGRAAPGQNTGAMMEWRAEPAAQQLGQSRRPAGRHGTAVRESRRSRLGRHRTGDGCQIRSNASWDSSRWPGAWTRRSYRC